MASIPQKDPVALKRAAAARALDYIEDGMKLGLGTGSTADLFLELLAERIRGGLAIIGTPTSERTADHARRLGIPLAELDSLGRLDLAVDGADEADGNLDLIKGGGGALLREKIVAASAARFVVIADESKFVDPLGSFPLPVEVVPFGHISTRGRIRQTAQDLGYEDVTLQLRGKDGEAFRTDNGNYIYDCAFGAITNAQLLATSLSVTPGIVDHGLFVGMASALVLAGPGGVRVLERN